MTDRPVPTGPPRRTSTIVETRVYRGPNVWSYDPAIHLVVDLGSLEEYPTDTLPGFTDHLLALLPGRRRALLLAGAQGRLRRAAARGHLARPRRRARRAAAAAGGRPRHPPRQDPQVKGEPGRYNVIYGYHDEPVGLAAGKLAVRLVNHLVAHDPEFDFDASSRSSCCAPSGPPSARPRRRSSTRPCRRDIPWIRLNSTRWCSSARASTPSGSAPR